LVSQPPPAAGDVALLGSRIANFFADMSKYKCTIAQASHDPPGHHMQKELYYWSEDYDGDLYEQADYLSSLSLPNYYYVPNPPDYRPIQIEA